ncbi:MAG: conjugal transfer protein TrbH [Pseudomonadota bacterium]
MKSSVLMVIVLLIAGCAVKTGQNFNSAPKLTQVEQQLIVSDAVKKLADLYLPAKTRLSFQANEDTFGISLLHDLREEGYAVQEQTQDTQKDPSGLQVRYILDQAGDLYRVTVMIGNDSLSRPYSLQNGVLTVAGCWVHKGNSHE